MKAQSDSLLKSLSHHGARGAARELFIKDFLMPFLPPAVGIGTGEIINHMGKCSKQIDVVLYNRGRLPAALVGSGDLGIFPWESVIATIEVKSKLDAKEVRSAILNAYSVRRVVHSLVEGYRLIGGKAPLDYRHWAFPIPSYVFAFDTDLVAGKTDITEIRNGRLGPEGARLFDQRAEVRNQHTRLLGLREAATHQGDSQEIAKFDRKLSEYSEERDPDASHGETSVSSEDLLGVCVLGREWAHGEMTFADETLSRYSDKPLRVMQNFNFCWSPVFADGSMKETLYFLKHLITLSHEMPRCFEHYQLDRYL